MVESKTRFKHPKVDYESRYKCDKHRLHARTFHTN